MNKIAWVLFVLSGLFLFIGFLEADYGLPPIVPVASAGLLGALGGLVLVAARNCK